MKKHLSNNNGIAAIYLAIIILAACAFVGLAIDIGYMYVVKTQLQNAADAGALAGAAKLDGSALTTQTIARQEAQKFTLTNKAGGVSVTTDLNSSNSKDGDIVLGVYDGVNFSETIGTNPVTGRPQIANAVKVVTRRTGETGTGIALNNPVQTFIAKVVGIDHMGVTASAIAGRPFGPAAPITMCVDGTKLPAAPGPPPVYQNYYFKESKPPTPLPAQGIAWTELQEVMSTNFGPDSDIAKLIRGEMAPPDVCGKYIASNNAGSQQIMKVLDDEFKLQAASSGLGYWDTVITIVNEDKNGVPGGCPPGLSSKDPHRVVGYAYVRITNVDLNPNPGITINLIDFVACSELETKLGLKPKLYR